MLSNKEQESGGCRSWLEEHLIGLSQAIRTFKRIALTLYNKPQFPHAHTSFGGNVAAQAAPIKRIGFEPNRN